MKDRLQMTHNQSELEQQIGKIVHRAKTDKFRPLAASVATSYIMELITANYTPNSEVAERERAVTPEFIKPGGLIPYKTIEGVEYVRLDWLNRELTKGRVQIVPPLEKNIGRFEDD